MKKLDVNLSGMGACIRLLPKLMVVCLLLTITSAKGVASAAQGISIDVSETPIQQVFEIITTQSGYHFAYSEDYLEQVRPVTVKVHNASIDAVMSVLLKDTNLAYVTRDNTVVISPSARSQQPANTRTLIRGMVVDQLGQPLIGVSVVVKGTTTGISTDAEGRFELNVELSPETVLVFSYVGKHPYEVVIGTQRDMHIVLHDEILTTGDVIVTGYYSLPKERSAGSFTSVEGEQLTMKANTSVLERLAGLVPGLTVNPAGDDKLLLRGANSINSNRAPLFVVDGMPIELSELESTVSAEDIQIVNVLKDASATSIWGVRASNGVIVLSTKRGRMMADQETTVNYSGTFQVRGRPDFDYLNNMNARDYVDFAIKQAQYAPELGGTGVMTPVERIYKDDSLSDVQKEAEYEKLRNSDNTAQIRKYLYQPRFIQQHNVSVSGGSEKASFFISANYRHTRPDRVGQTEDRLIFNAKNDVRLLEWAKFSFDANVMYDDSKSKYTPDVVGMVPYELLRDESTGENLSQTHMFYSDGNMARIDGELDARKMMTYRFRMLDELDRQTNRSKVLHARVQAKLTLDLFKGMQFASSIQYQRGSGLSTRLDHENSYKVLDMIAQYTPLSATKSMIPAGGRMDKTHSFSNEWVARNQFDYNVTIDGNHNITALLGTEVRKRDTETDNRVLWGYTESPFVTYANLDQAMLISGVGSTITAPDSGANKMMSESQFGNGIVRETPRFFSLYGNFAYDFKNLYALNASIRIDQANTFGTGVRWKPVWSVGGLWNLSQEDFFRSNTFDRLALRVSYGITGMVPNTNHGGPYDLIAKGTTSNLYYDQPDPIVSLISPANHNLEWERTRSLNFGADYAILNGRIRGSLDVYFKKTSGLIAPMTMDPTLGFQSMDVNLADMKNSGVELSVNSRNIAVSDFQWETAFNFSYNKNTVLNVYNAPLIGNYVSTYMPVFVKDRPAYALYSFRYAGLDDQGEPMVYDTNGEKTAAMISDVDALVYSGTAQPPFSGGMTNTFRYRNFTFEFQILYNLGHKMRRDVPRVNASSRVLYNQTSGNDSPWINPIHNDYKYAWTPENTDTDIPRWSPTGSRTTSEYYPAADVNIVSASYISLNDITLSYSLPAKVTDRLGLKSCTVSAQVHDPLIWTRNNDGIDPRYMGSMIGMRRSLKYGPEYMFRLNVQF